MEMHDELESAFNSFVPINSDFRKQNRNQMEYFLQPAILAPTKPLEISEDEYHALVKSRAVLNAAFSLEENFDLLLGNYIEMENSALAFATVHMVRTLHAYHEMFETRAEMNRRGVNFLTSARLYVDQILSRVGECGGDRDAVKARRSAEYDGAFEYRFMEAIRNHVQHSGSAVHSLSIGGERDADTTNRIYALGVYSQRRYLAADKDFKKVVLAECPDQIDFLACARRYLSGLSDLHEFARQVISKQVEDARSAFQSAIERYKEFTGASAVALTAYSASQGRKEGTAIFLDWDDVRIKLEGRNRNVKNLQKTVISSVGLKKIRD